jgi:hypothetical protein
MACHIGSGSWRALPEIRFQGSISSLLFLEPDDGPGEHVGFEYSKGLRGQPCLLAAGAFPDLQAKVVRLCLPDFAMGSLREQSRAANLTTSSSGTTLNATNSSSAFNFSMQAEEEEHVYIPTNPMQFTWPLDKAWEAVLPDGGDEVDDVGVGVEQDASAALVLAHFA